MKVSPKKSRVKRKGTPLAVPEVEKSTSNEAAFVTPSTVGSTKDSSERARGARQTTARRTLFPSSTTQSTTSTGLASVVTPQLKDERKRQADNAVLISPPAAKRRLMFGRYVDAIICPPNVEKVYKIVKKLTGSIGGNGYVGPIYGELTMVSMQKMVHLMMEHCNLNKESRFVDVGSGIGKPNLHVAQYPGVAFSCGVEVEQTRWALGMSCLKAVLDEAVVEHQTMSGSDALPPNDPSRVLGNTVFLHMDIQGAKTFDPFTHVYMFSIGFPPPLWLKLSDMWNRSCASEYLICYHSPRDIIDCYEFDVELIAQTSTSMHGSKEGHMGYIYKRTKPLPKNSRSACDPVFRPSWNLVKRGIEDLHSSVAKDFDELMGSGRKTRSRRR